jgi:hypothetical protein
MTLFLRSRLVCCSIKSSAASSSEFKQARCKAVFPLYVEGMNDCMTSGHTSGHTQIWATEEKNYLTRRDSDRVGSEALESPSSS